MGRGSAVNSDIIRSEEHRLTSCVCTSSDAASSSCEIPLEIRDRTTVAMRNFPSKWTMSQEAQADLPSKVHRVMLKFGHLIETPLLFASQDGIFAATATFATADMALLAVQTMHGLDIRSKLEKQTDTPVEDKHRFICERIFKEKKRVLLWNNRRVLLIDQRIYLWKNKQILLWSRTGEAAEVFSLWRSKRVFSLWSSSKTHASSGEANGYSYVTQASALQSKRQTEALPQPLMHQPVRRKRALSQPEQREKKRIIEEKEQKSVMQRVKEKQTEEKKHCNRNHHRQQEPTDPCFLACANPHCNFLVHPDPVLNGFCCRTCAWNFKSGGKYEKKHGRMCKRIRAPNNAPKAEPIMPGDMINIEDKH